MESSAPASNQHYSNLDQLFASAATSLKYLGWTMKFSFEWINRRCLSRLREETRTGAMKPHIEASAFTPPSPLFGRLGLVFFNTRHLHIKLFYPFSIKFETGIQDLNFKWKSFDEYLYPGTLRQVQTVLCHPSVSLSRGDNSYLLIGPCFKVYFCTYITLILEMPGCVYNTDFDF